MNYDRLKAELTDDPLARGYSGMNDAEAATSLNTVNRERMRSTLTAAEIFEAVDMMELEVLTGLAQIHVRDIFVLVEPVRVGPGSKTRAMFLDQFGLESSTVQALLAAATEELSRAAEFRLPFVYPGYIENARM